MATTGDPLATLATHALGFVRDGAVVGLGSGRAASAFVRALAARVHDGLRVRGVATSGRNGAPRPRARHRSRGAPRPTSTSPWTAPTRSTASAEPHQGLRRRLRAGADRRRGVSAAGHPGDRQTSWSRPSAVTAASRSRSCRSQLPLCRRRLGDLELKPTLRAHEDGPFVTDNFNVVLDCAVGPIEDPAALEQAIRAIPGGHRHRACFSEPPTRSSSPRAMKFASSRPAGDRRERAETTFRLPDGLAGGGAPSSTGGRAGDRVKRLGRGTRPCGPAPTRRAGSGGSPSPASSSAAARARSADLADEIRRAGFAHALVLGMGGSSLCPGSPHGDFRPHRGHPELLRPRLAPTRPRSARSSAGSTWPARSSSCRASPAPRSSRTSSCSTSSIASGGRSAPSAPAVTSSRSPTRASRMEQVAGADHFRRVIPGVPSIGGRYSALSDFGMAPAAIMGLDVARFLAHAAAMADRCGPLEPRRGESGRPARDSPRAFSRGADADKVTLVASPGIADARRLARAAPRRIDGQGG